MLQSAVKNYDLIVSGAGLPGASLALGAVRRGLRVALIDRRSGLVNTGDTRTTALLPESLHMLKALGLWELVRPQAQALEIMRLIDDRGARRDAPEQVLFSGKGASPLAYNLPNQALATALATALAAEAPGRLQMFWDSEVLNAEVLDGQALVHLRGGARLQAPLAVAADGRDSRLRQSLRIGWRSLSCSQTAVTARLRHGQAHGGVSTEFHRTAGPMTFVPIVGDGHDSALVWGLSDTVARQVFALDEAVFLARVALASRGVVGKIEAASVRGYFPVRPGVAKAFSKGPFILIAEAAHTLPPLLAQGLNLSLKDVEILLQVLGDLGPSPRAAAHFARRRWPDTLARLGASEGLNLALRQGGDLATSAYQLAMAGLQRLPAARALAVQLGQRGVQTMPEEGA